jgi:ATP-dependent Zn protease
MAEINGNTNGVPREDTATDDEIADHLDVFEICDALTRVIEEPDFQRLPDHLQKSMRDLSRDLSEMRRSFWLVRTAFHEAGHAVIGRVLKQVCGYATIIEDTVTHGHSIIADPWHTYDHWDRAGRWRRNEMRSIHRGSIITIMAGAEAEVEFFGNCAGGDTHDREQIAPMLDEFFPSDGDFEHRSLRDEQRRELREYVQRLRQRETTRLLRATQRLVRRHRGKIEHVATELLKRKTLQGEEIDAIVGIVAINKAPSVSALAR